MDNPEKFRWMKMRISRMWDTLWMPAVKALDQRGELSGREQKKVRMLFFTDKRSKSSPPPPTHTLLIIYKIFLMLVNMIGLHLGPRVLLMMLENGNRDKMGVREGEKEGGRVGK